MDLGSDSDSDTIDSNDLEDLMGNFAERPSGDNAEDDFEQDQQPPTYDLSLTMQHSYMGGDFTLLQGRTLLDDDSRHWIPILPKAGLVLIPGHTLPLTVTSPVSVAMLHRIMEGNRIFGVVCLNQIGSNPYILEAHQLADVGTTAEIYESHDQSERKYQVKAVGRQRFKIIDLRKHQIGYLEAFVQILPEIVLPEPMAEIRHDVLDRYRSLSLDAKANERRRALFKVRDSMMGTWPSWVYGQYDSNQLVKRISDGLNGLNVGNTKIPTDPVELSFWVGTLCVSSEHRLHILRMNSAVQRLQWELNVIHKFCGLYCASCDKYIAHQSNIFCMSSEGFQGAYCNEHGYVHETMTLSTAQGLKLVGSEPNTDFSWFPGYGWTIAVCEQCNTHMGWLFTAVKPELKPQKFWGLTRASLSSPLARFNQTAALHQDEN